MWCDNCAIDNYDDEICYNCGVYCTYPDEEYYEDEDDYYDNFYGEEDGQYYYEDDYNDEDYGEEEEYEEEFDYYNDEDDHREKRCYGCFQCPNCRKRWDSAYVFCRKQRGSLRCGHSTRNSPYNRLTSPTHSLYSNETFSQLN
ncbi:hypothetical protein C0Q70_14802 [Pomacea canaliculata]|uniref:Uncharacterized protein n=1 Tax=Pomacea canaliculata TaxID=400727 RepID=A0A2T7NT32_POMCA|nr:hypothetical protein C0Q70_14802 [Pomacea canaliculata]